MGTVAKDNSPGLHPGAAGPATRGVAVTPDDHNQLAFVARLLYVGGTGDLKVTLRDDLNPVTFKAVPVGMFQVWVKQVWATGTTATQIIAVT